MTYYQPRAGLYVGRPPCRHCGAAYRLHHPARQIGQPMAADPPRVCPEPYRPADLETAQRELAQAVESGDPAREFVARGNVQQLMPPRPRVLSSATWALGPDGDRHEHVTDGQMVYQGPSPGCPHCAYGPSESTEKGY